MNSFSETQKFKNLNRNNFKSGFSNKFAILSVFLSLSVFADSADLKCSYKIYTNIGYACNFLDGVRLNSSDNVIITGQHLSGKSDSDVSVVAFYDTFMREIPSSLFDKFLNMTELKAENSFLSEIRVTGHNLRRLSAKANRVTELDADTFAIAANLEQIYMQDNWIVSINENAFSSLQKLEILDLSRNNINHLFRDTFKHLNNLKRLLLNANSLEKLDEGLFRNNAKLEHIQLSNNRLINIYPHIFENSFALKAVGLSYNYCINDYYEIQGSINISKLNEDLMQCVGGRDLVIEQLLTKQKDAETKCHDLSFQSAIVNHPFFWISLVTQFLIILVLIVLLYYLKRKSMKILYNTTTGRSTKQESNETIPLRTISSDVKV